MNEEQVDLKTTVSKFVMHINILKSTATVKWQENVCISIDDKVIGAANTSCGWLRYSQLKENAAFQVEVGGRKNVIIFLS